MRKFIITIAILFSLPVFAMDIPQSQGKVTDLANVLTKEQRQNLVSKLEKLEKENADHPQIGILTVPVLADEGIEELANQTFHSWGIGQKDKDNGLLLVIAPNQRKMRLEVGYGLEDVIPDSTAQRIIDGMKNDLRAKRYYSAFDGAVDRMVSYLPKTKQERLEKTKKTIEQIVSVFVVVLQYSFYAALMTIPFLYVYKRRKIREAVRKKEPELTPEQRIDRIKQKYNITDDPQKERDRIRKQYTPVLNRTQSNSLRTSSDSINAAIAATEASRVAEERSRRKLREEEEDRARLKRRTEESSSSSWSSGSSWSSPSSSDSGSSWGGGDSGGGGASGDW